MRKMVAPGSSSKSAVKQAKPSKSTFRPPEKPVIKEEYASFRLVPKKSKIHRWGIFAGEDIPPRRKVIEYLGEKINRMETKRRGDAQDRTIYLFTLDNYWTLDGAVGGSGAEFINHCCDPNVTTEIRGGRIIYISRRPIRKGEELTVDYRFDKKVEKVTCKCGSPKCRGTINLK
jgi:SET domain-containing protein